MKNIWLFGSIIIVIYSPWALVTILKYRTYKMFHFELYIILRLDLLIFSDWQTFHVVSLRCIENLSV